jgi:hypothetical protein
MVVVLLLCGAAAIAAVRLELYCSIDVIVAVIVQ